MKKKRKKQQNTEQKSTTAEQTNVAYTPEEVEEILDELAAAPKRQRIWEVDFLRGLMILFVVWDHFMWDVMGVSRGEYNTALFNWFKDLYVVYYSSASIRNVAHDVFVTLFVFTSGISCSFSRSNGRRAIKMIFFAVALTLATYGISSVVQRRMVINFNVIHVIALSTLLWAVIDWVSSLCNKNWKRNLFGVTMTAIILVALLLGSYAKYCVNILERYHYVPLDFVTSDNPVWFFLYQHSRQAAGFDQFWGVDYLAFFPDFGWFLIGAFLGRFLYKEKKTLFPSVNAKWVSPITFCGRNSLWIYVLSQIVMFAFFYLFHGVLNLL